MVIDDPRKWRISMSGLSIKTGWAGDKTCIAKYAGRRRPMNHAEFKTWMENAIAICDAHNASLK